MDSLLMTEKRPSTSSEIVTSRKPSLNGLVAKQIVPINRSPPEGRSKNTDGSAIESNDSRSIPTSKLSGHTIRIGRKIGNGNFGVVRVGRSTNSGDLVAIKLEKTTTTTPQLRHEYDVYRHLNSGEGIPVVYALTFVRQRRYCALVMELLGPNLVELLESCGGRFSIRTVALIATQLIRRMQFIHAKGYVYRDVKPENFTIGYRKDSRHVIHVVDFGLAKRYLDMDTRQHVPYRENKHITGTARFISINMHEGKEMSRRDDLEALGYLFVFLARGQLPWQTRHGRRQVTELQLLSHIYEMKKHTPVIDLCQGLPGEFGLYLTYVRNLDYFALPNYDRLYALFSRLVENNEWPNNPLYEWTENVLAVTPSELLIVVGRTKMRHAQDRTRPSRHGSIGTRYTENYSNRAMDSHEDRSRQKPKQADVVDEPSLSGTLFCLPGSPPHSLAAGVYFVDCTAAVSTIKGQSDDSTFRNNI